MDKFNIILRLVGDEPKATWPDGPHFASDPKQYAIGYVEACNANDPELELVGVQRLVETRRRRVAIEPWTAAEKKEIAQLRKKGWSDSRIRGWMKTGNNRKGQCPPLDEKESMMATKKKTAKKTTKKKTTKKAAAKKAPAKKAGRKKAAAPGRKKGEFKIGENLTAVKGQDDQFYKKFPRYKAYQLICKKGKMKTAAFIDAVEKLEGVKSRGQALGILTKLIDKGCIKAS